MLLLHTTQGLSEQETKCGMEAQKFLRAKMFKTRVPPTYPMFWDWYGT
jgi:hypothetical protein